MDRAVNAGACLCPGGYAAGIGFALFYGFCGVIATGHGWTALYPPTAGTVLLRFRMDPTPRELACAAFSLLASLGFAVALGVALCLATGADIYAAHGVQFATPWIGVALTGIFASRGSNYLSDLAKRLQTVLAGK